jgi:hypothetical protein
LVSLGFVTLIRKSHLKLCLWVLFAAAVAFLLYRFWVLPTADVGAIYDLGGLDPETHSQYEIDVDQIHRFWTIHIVPPSWYRDPEHGVYTYSWLAAEHRARAAATVVICVIIIAYAGFRHLKRP